MEKFKIEMTEDEMIKYYANKIVEDGIKECNGFCDEFNQILYIQDYGELKEFSNKILQRIYRDERVADVNLDEDGFFDIVYYTDYCPFYYDIDFIVESEYNSNLSIKNNLLEEFVDFYSKECLFKNRYISVRNLLNQFTENYSDIQEERDEIKNIIKQVLVVSNFIENNIDGIEVYLTLENYKELEKAIEEYIQNVQEQELE